MLNFILKSSTGIKKHITVMVNENSYNFSLENMTIKNARENLATFCETFASIQPEYEKDLEKMMIAYRDDKFDDMLEIASKFNEYGKQYVDSLNIDLNEYCDESKRSKKAKNNIFIDKETMYDLLVCIATCKLVFMFLADNKKLSKLISDKFIYQINGKLFDDGFFDILFQTIRNTSHRFAITNRNVWNFLTYKYGENNMGYILTLFNAFTYQFLCTYNFELGKNPMTYIRSVINSSFDWLFKLGFNDLNVTDEDNEIYYEQDLMVSDLSELIMNEDMFNNHVLFGLKYMFDGETIKYLLKKCDTTRSTSMMDTLGTLLISRMTGISTEFLNKRKNSHVILNNLFLSKFLTKIFPDSTYFKKLALLLKVVPNPRKSRIRKKKMDENFYKKLLDNNYTFYGITDHTVVISAIQKIIYDLEYQVIDIITGKQVTLPSDFIDVILETLNKLNDKNDKDLKYLRDSFLYVVNVENRKKIKHINNI